jgi:hypothetical protein
MTKKTRTAAKIDRLWSGATTRPAAGVNPTAKGEAREAGRAPEGLRMEDWAILIIALRRDPRGAV